MSVKERERKAVMEQVRQGYISQAEAARQLKLSYRQTKRVWRRYRREGDTGLVHRSRGRPSGQGYSKDFKQSVVALYEDRYMGFGPQHASEKMLQYEDITMVPETLRLWLKEAGLWSRQRRRQAYRKRRERKAHFGDMLQIDGSIHEWIEGQPKSCLLNMVDDATGITYAQIDTGETTRILLECLLAWVKQYGIPKSVYVDRKTVYIGRKDFSAFQEVCQRLGIKVIRAYSPQAKGRVECKHNVFQTRFVKEIRLLKITSIDEANTYLTNEFLDDINRRFGKKPVSTEDGHRPSNCRGKPESLFYWAFSRIVLNDWTIRHGGKYYQITKTRPLVVRPKYKVEVRRYLDGSLKVFYKDTSLAYKQLDGKPSKPKPVKPAYTSAKRSQAARACKHRSPWSQYNPKWLHPDRRSRT